MQVILAMTGYFGLRTGEAVALRVEDVSLKSDVPKITVQGDTKGAKKSPGDVYIRKQHLAWMRKLMTKGISVNRTKKHKHGKGKGKRVTFENTYKPPKDGCMFPSRRSATVPHVCYHAVYLQVKKAAPLFLKRLKEQGGAHSPEVGRLRPHSGLLLASMKAMSDNYDILATDTNSFVPLGRATLITELMGEGVGLAMFMKYALET